MFAPGAMPRLPEIAEPMSVRMSPNRFDATMTSSVCGMRDHPRGERVDVVLRGTRPPDSPARTISATSSHSTIECVQRVRLRRAREHLARPLRRDLEAVAQDPLDAVPREDAGLLRDLVRRADVDAAADAGVLAFGVLAHADHVDVRRRRGWRAARSGPASSRIGRRFTY